MEHLRLYKKQFDDLSPSELYEIVKLRLDVFVVEQVCPYLDLDDIDQQSWHIWYGEASKVQAYVRVVPPGYSHDKYCSIGRVVTSGLARGIGLGKKVFEAGMQSCKDNFPNTPIKISAQLYLQKFYASFGFIMQDKIYLEDGIPHIAMYYGHTGP